MNIFGIDGAPQGWSVAYRQKDGKVNLTLVRNLNEFMERFPEATHIAIDMIIGLPDKAYKGGRTAEKEARKLLSPRGSVVFSSPCRDAVYADNYQEALTINRRSSSDHVGLSKQSFNISSKIKEVDLFIRTHTGVHSRIYETHPELSFWEMNQKTPLYSKHSKEGREQRVALLKESKLLPNMKLTKDDLDALACLWSAIRIQKKQANSIPYKVPRDRLSLPMKITW